MTSQASHADQVEWPARMMIIEQRADALAALWAADRSGLIDN
jgi:hypothetical protein